jgi:hypothetical protein
MTENKIIYLTIQDIIEFNILILSFIKTKKADKSEVLSYKKIQDIVSGCKNVKGDIYDKVLAATAFDDTAKHKVMD